jgi:hypothetical protein
MANAIGEFGGLNLFFLVILHELTIECVIWFCRFVRDFENPNGNALKKG